MGPSFTAHFRVRFDECAADGMVRASAILRYVIETAFAHSADAGFPLAWYDRRGMYWLVRRAKLLLAQPIAYGTEVGVTTEVMGFRRIWARRQNTVAGPAGTVLGEVAMDWIFTDLTGQPVRVVPEMIAAFPGVPDRLTPARLDLGVRPPDVQPEEFLVPAHVIDPRGHVNSAAYLDVLDDVLTSRGVNPQARPATYELEYFRAAQWGDRLQRYLWQDAGGWAIVMTDAEGALMTQGYRAAN